MKLAKIISKKSLYQLIIANFLIVFLVVLLMIPIYLKAYNVLKTSVINNTVNTVERGLDDLTNDLDNINYVSYNLQKSELLQYMSGIQGKLSIKDYIDMVELREKMKEMMLHIKTISNSYIFFRNSNIAIAQDKVFDDASTFNKIYPDKYESFNKYKNSLMNLNSNKSVISYNEKMLMYINTIPCNSVYYQSVLVSLISVNDVIKILADKNVIDNGFVSVYDVKGNLILTNNKNKSFNIVYDNLKLTNEVEIDNKKYTVIKTQELKSGLTVLVGLPEHMFIKQIKPIMRVLNLYVLIACTAGIFVSVILAFKEYKPIKRLVQMANKFNDNIDNNNGDLEYLKQVFLSTSKQSKQLSESLFNMKKQVAASVFEKALNGALLETSINNEINKHIPWLPKKFIIITIKNKQYSSEVTATLTEQYFKEYFINYEYYIHPTMHNYVVIIFKCETDGEYNYVSENLKTIIYSDVNKTRNMVCGLSKRHDKYNEIRLAYHEGLYAIKYCDRFKNKLISIFEGKNVDDVIFNIKDVGKLYEILLSGCNQAVDEFFEVIYSNIIETGNISEEHFEQLYYQVKGIIVSVCKEIARMDLLYDKKEYEDFTTIKEMIIFLTNKSHEICEIVNVNKKSNNVILRDEILNYIDSNFDNSNLYAKTLAEKFSISEKYLFNFIKEQTGKSLGEIIENKRLNYAVELIKTTNIPFKKIALKCGFNSVNTFYKAFKRIYGITPGSMRKSN